jgi:uncharacterized protein YbjT (DUF2867 family)
VIVNVGGRRPGSIADRLLSALEARGHRTAGPAAGEAPVLFFCADTRDEPGPRAADASSGARWLVVTRLGAHRDARHPLLRACWEWEEAARASGRPTLALRLGPLLGPASPLWLRLCSDPALPRGGRQLLNPVAEADAVETVHRALGGTGEWAGWYEVAGAEAWSLAELAALACAAGPRAGAGPGDWEPPLDEMREHRLAEAGPWLERFGLAPRPLAEQAGAWAAAAPERAA